MLGKIRFDGSTRATWPALLALALSVAPAAARADGGDGVIHACVNLNSGLLRVVTVQGACRPPEVPLDWSVQAPAGGGASGYETVSHQEWLEAGAVVNVHVDCSPGKRVLGGGFDVETPQDVKVYSSEPTDGHGNAISTGWNVLAWNAGAVTRQVTVTAICAVLP